MVSTQLKNISQIGSFPQVGVKIKNLWNHHLATHLSSFLQTRGPTIMRWVKPLCGAVAEIQSLNILCIQPLHMVAWQFVQYTPPGETKKTQWILGAPSLTIHHQFGGSPLAFWSEICTEKRWIPCTFRVVDLAPKPGLLQYLDPASSVPSVADCLFPKMFFGDKSATLRWS